MYVKTIGLLCVFTFVLTIVFQVQYKSSQQYKGAINHPFDNTQLQRVDVLGYDTESIENAQKKEKENEFIQTPIHVLILGIDARIGDANPRCDAIHMVSVDPVAKTITITSIPRGTSLSYAGLNDGTIVANACHTYGKDYAIAQIEKIAGIQADYTVFVGFSQTLGILRTLGLPTTPTLQFLRNRRYGIGDNQRSRNQAQFIKDQILTHSKFMLELPRPIQQVAYHMLDTNMSFDLALAILKTIDAFNIIQDESKIQLISKPSLSPYVKEFHLSSDDLSDTSWMNDDEYKVYQAELRNYIENLIIKGESRMLTNSTAAHQLISTPFKQQIWLQVEDNALRNLYHFDLLKLFISSSPYPQDEIGTISSFLSEMEAIGNEALRDKGKEYLDSIISL